MDFLSFTFGNLPDVDGLLELAHVPVVGRDVEDGRQRLRQLHRELQTEYWRIFRASYLGYSILALLKVLKRFGSGFYLVIIGLSTG